MAYWQPFGLRCGLSNAVSYGIVAYLYESFFTVVMATLDTLSKLLVFVNEIDDTPVMTLRLACSYEQNQAAAFEMLDFLKGPEEVSNYVLRWRRT